MLDPAGYQDAAPPAGPGTGTPARTAPTADPFAPAPPPPPREVREPQPRARTPVPACTGVPAGERIRTGPGRRLRSRLRLWSPAALCGPAFVVSVAYVDPGNFATNTAAGARYGYLLLWVVVSANVLAMFVQYLSAKLGIATGRSLPELCRRHCPRPVAWLLWAQAEAVAAATDLAEVIGGAIALNLLWGVPVLPGCGITAGVALLMLLAAPYRRRRFRVAIAGMMLTVLGGFLYQAVVAGTPGRAAGGLVPGLAGGDSLLLATGIVGATVMPHAVYLHSDLTADRDRGDADAPAAGCAAGGPGRDRPAADGPDAGPAALRRRLRACRRDVVVALALAGLANAAMLTVAATVLHPHRKAGADTLSGAHHALHDLLGAPAATAFALALLAAGLASSSVGVCAGDAIMRGFLRRRIHPLLRRLAGLVPALALLACGIEPTRALLLSQAALCFGVPCALIPLTWLTGKRSVTGPLANRPLTTAAAGGAATLISALNLLLLMQFLPR